jgi:hypothetical protein
MPPPKPDRHVRNPFAELDKTINYALLQLISIKFGAIGTLAGFILSALGAASYRDEKSHKEASERFTYYG